MASINIHVGQCEKKFLDQQAVLPVRERKPLPKAIDYSALLTGSGGGRSGSDVEDTTTLVEALNEQARNASASLMSECEFCGRKFNPDRLVIHNRSCTADNPHKRLLSGGGLGGGNVPQLQQQLPVQRESGPRPSSAGATQRPSTSAGGAGRSTTPTNLPRRGGGGGAGIAGGLQVPQGGGEGVAVALERLRGLQEKVRRLQADFNRQMEGLQGEIREVVAELGGV